MNKANRKSPNGSNPPKGKGPLVKAPVAQARIVRNPGPRQKQYLPNGDIRIAHREYFNDLTTPGADFNVSTYNINPGLSNVFPWLSQIANNWETYVFEKLDFCFETESATSQVGTVILTVDYDAADAAPDTKSDAMTYRGAVRSAPWTSSCHRSLREDLVKMKERYVRNGTLASNLDIKTYDVGTLFVCTQGQTGVATLGELYVDYVIVLKTPQISTNPTLSKIASGGSGLSGSDLTGTGATLTGSLPLTNSAASTFLFGTDWEGIVRVLLTGTTLATPLVVNTSTADVSIISGSIVNGAATTLSAALLVSATVGQTLIVTASAASVTASSFRFAEYDNSLG